MIRVAAVGDVHASDDREDLLAPGFADLDERADVLLLAGDLTRRGTREEADALGRQLLGVTIPKVAVLGNHDHHSGDPDAVVAALAAHGVTVLRDATEVVEVGGERLGVAGVKGFAGGFGHHVLTAFGEPEIKAFVGVAEDAARALRRGLTELAACGCQARVALLHYAPVADTVADERPEIHAFLGSQKLAEAIDRAGADLVVHGHAHRGPHLGTTPGGVPVRNVAMPLMGEPYRVFTVGPG
ncbi:MAG: metallophosphoesterase [Thermoleophilia bacterium]